MTAVAPRQDMWSGFRHGLLTGVLAALVGTLLSVYALNVLGFMVVSVSSVPHVQDVLLWAYANLRLSVIPFILILVLYAIKLRKLGTLLARPGAEVTEIFHTERWVDSAVSLFFGTGVIWTAVGMRSALLFGVGALDQATAAELGAFQILRRLVDGGILLALSTTIVGAVGGYLMRIAKTLAVGTELQDLHARLASDDSERLDRRLRNIEHDVARLAGRTSAVVGRADPDRGPRDADRPSAERPGIERSQRSSPSGSQPQTARS